jgi:hypothetical protein
LMVAMHTDAPDKLAATVTATKAIAAERGAAAIVATREGGEWAPAVILRPRGDRSLDPLLRCFPEVAVLPV